MEDEPPPPPPPKPAKKKKITDYKLEPGQTLEDLLRVLLPQRRVKDYRYLPNVQIREPKKKMPISFRGTDHKIEQPVKLTLAEYVDDQN